MIYLFPRDEFSASVEMTVPKVSRLELTVSPCASAANPLSPSVNIPPLSRPFFV